MSEVNQAAGGTAQGSIGQALASHVGELANVEFIIGLDTIVCKTGRIKAISGDLLTLHDDANNTDTLADTRLIAFAVVPSAGEAGGDTPSDSTPSTAASAVAPTMARNPRAGSQAAFNYAKRKARR